MSSESREYADWPRVPVTIPPCPPGRTTAETEQALFAVCQPLWAASKIPVVAWGSDYDGTELLPPAVH